MPRKYIYSSVYIIVYLKYSFINGRTERRPYLGGR